VSDPLISPSEFLRHALATLAYRGGKALREAPADFADFQPRPGSRTPGQILAHIGDLLDWALSHARGQEKWHDSTPLAWDAEVARFHEALAALDAQLAQPDGMACPWQRLFQGPIADALTHVGQIAMLRRIAGGAIRGENYFKAEITQGRVGAAQTTPRREFD
jgi:hypothetical protein